MREVAVEVQVDALLGEFGDGSGCSPIGRPGTTVCTSPSSSDSRGERSSVNQSALGRSPSSAWCGSRPLPGKASEVQSRICVLDEITASEPVVSSASSPQWPRSGEMKGPSL